MRKVLLLVVAIVIVVAVYNVVHHGASHLKAGGGPPGSSGTIAPEISLRDLNGKPLTLADYKGKVVLLDFWATWCTPCRGEIPHFVEFQNNYHDQGLQVIGVSMDDDAKPVAEFYQQYKMNYPVGMGTTQLADAYGGILGLPVTFLIGRDGRIVQKYVGAVDMATVEQQMKSSLQEK